MMQSETEIRAKQWGLMSGGLYDFDDAPKQTAVRLAYDETVTQLAKLLGPEAHCAHVDNDLWSLFSDLYKDRCHMRPRGHYTVAFVTAWIERNSETIEGDDA